MARRSWHQFVLGNVYARDLVVAAIEQHLKSGKVIDPDDKWDHLERIKKMPAKIRFTFSKTSHGWGISPMNSNCWTPA
jgi:hypothetical protein